MPKHLPLVLLALCLSACNRSDSGAADKNREADLIFAVGDEHNHLDPQRISWVSDGRIANCLYEPLVKFDADTLEIIPGVAESWDVSDDKLTYTFHLREDARWSDGQPVTAGDFIYAWRRAMLPDVAADYAMLMFTIEGGKAFFDWRTNQLTEYAAAPDVNDPALMWKQALEQFDKTVAVKAVDDRTLTVKLVNPTPYFIELCAFVTFMPNPRHVVGAMPKFSNDTGMLRADPKYWSDPERLVTNGPYVMQRRQFKRDLLMVANDQYHGRAAMRNDSILEKIVPDPQSTVIAYEAGEVDFLPDLGVNASVTADLAAQDRDDVHLVPMAGVYFYNFNCLPTKPDGSPNPLADVKVRRALSMGIDRKTLVSQVTRMNQPVVKSFVPPGVLPDYDPPEEAGIGFDPATGKNLLAEAGYPGGKGLTGLSILYNTGFGHERIAQAIKRMWEQHLGVVVTLEGVEVKSFAERLKKQDYTICRASWFGDYRDPTTWLDKCISDNGNNDCRYTNPQFDALMQQAAAEPDTQKRNAILREAEALMLQDSPMAMIYQYISVYVYDPQKVKHMCNNAWNLWRLEQVEVRR